MRPRNKKNLNSRINNCEAVIENSPERLKGRWHENYREVHVEVGCGKGAFIIGMAEKNPHVLFVGIECIKNVIVTAAEKAIESGCENIILINGNARFMGDFFEEGEIDKLYLNFSDPWPRDKQAKNRLTSDTYMPLYAKLLKDNGILRQKTDNRPLFDFSVEVYKNFPCEILQLSYDLHAEPDYEQMDNVVTEYEARFVRLETPICFAEVKMPDRKIVADKIKACEEALGKRKEMEDKFLISKGLK